MTTEPIWVTQVKRYLEWKKKYLQEKWEKESLEEYERSLVRHGDHDMEQGPSS